jgi:hypothetical protein
VGEMGCWRSYGVLAFGGPGMENAVNRYGDYGRRNWSLIGECQNS